jgi:hypothetical protein
MLLIEFQDINIIASLDHDFLSNFTKTYIFYLGTDLLLQTLKEQLFHTRHCNSCYTCKDKLNLIIAFQETSRTNYILSS